MFYSNIECSRLTTISYELGRHADNAGVMSVEVEEETVP